MSQEYTYPEPWWKWKPVFELGLDEICPYIWLGWFLITWGPRSPVDGVRWFRDINISFCPD